MSNTKAAQANIDNEHTLLWSQPKQGVVDIDQTYWQEIKRYEP